MPRQAGRTVVTDNRLSPQGNVRIGQQQQGQFLFAQLGRKINAVAGIVRDRGSLVISRGLLWIIAIVVVHGETKTDKSLVVLVGKGRTNGNPHSGGQQAGTFSDGPSVEGFRIDHAVLGACA